MAVGIAVAALALALAAVAGGTQPYETYETTIAEDHPAAQFRFDDPAGSATLADTVGDFTATNSGVALGGEGPFGGSKSGLFGGEAFATLPSSPLSGASEFTVEAWVDWTGGTSYRQPIFDFGSSSSDYIYLTPSSALAKHPLLLEIHTSGGSVAQITAPKLSAKTWEFVAVTETAAGALTLYLDGEPVGQPVSATISPASLGSTPSDYLGKSLVSGAADFKGRLSNVAFYTTALSAERIMKHYHAAEFPVSTTAPTISGTAKDGKTLTAKAGSWTGLTPISVAYQWERCTEGCVAIVGADQASYEAKNEDAGASLRVSVIATNRAGAGSATSAQTAPVEAIKLKDLTPPVISGSAQVGQELTVSDGTWEGSPPTSYRYEWETCNGKGAKCKVIAGASGQTYEPLASQVSEKDTLRAVVTGENFSSSASATSAATSVIAPGPPREKTLPTITGTAEAGQLLTAGTGTWAGTEPIEYSYQWQRCDAMGAECEAVSGATAAQYEVPAADSGATLEVVVTARNTVGTASASSPATAVVPAVAPSNTAPPTVSGTTEEGQTIAASTGSWSGTSPLLYGYQWQSCDEHGESCQDVEGATGASYRLGPGDVGNTLRVVVTASNAGGFASATSAASAVIGTSVTAPLSLAAPEVSGTAHEGLTLSASVGTWTGTPPLSYSYQWESCNSVGESCADVAGASGSTYQLDAGDVGGRLRVLVTATNAAGVASRISGPSAPVAGPVPRPESTCTDTWVGPAEGSWREGANWSAGTAPGPSDVACLGPETAVSVSEGSERVGVLDDAGELAISGGSLELADASAASTVGALTLSGRGAALTGPGSLYVSSGFDWGAYGAMSGPGRTVIEPGVTGTVEADSGCEPMSLSGARTLVNEGTLTFGWGTLFISEGALLENRGVFADNSEASCDGPQIQPEGSGAAPSLLDVGTFEKTADGGTSTVAVPFTNDGSVRALGGTLEFTGGGVAERPATGAWSAESGSSIVLAGGAFPIGEAVNLSQVNVEGATVERVSASAPTNTAPPAIAGDAQDGQTLRASTGSWSGTEPISLAYQWQRCNREGDECRDVAGGTGDSYVLAGADVGATVRVLVTATNADGQTTQPSPVSAVVAPPAPPSNTAPPQITGTAQDGSVLSVSTGRWNAAPPVSYTYQWESCDAAGQECAPVEYATSSEYELGEGDIGSTLRVVVTATNAGGSTQATSVPSSEIQAEPVSELEAPSISGAPDEHQVLYADPGRWAGTETQLSYQWESCSERGAECAPIEGATGTEYDLSEGDLATTLRVRVGASDALDSLTDVSAPTPVIGAPGALADTSAPSISGVPQSGQALTANPGTWSGAGTVSYAYQWQSCGELGLECADIDGASSATYTPAAGEAGGAVRVLVTATDEQGQMGSLASPATQPIAAAQAPAIEQAPVISGAALAGHTLTAGTGVLSGEGPISYAYQWERCEQPQQCAPIEGATHSSYTLGEGDVGSTLLVLVTAADGGGSTTGVSAPTAAVEPEALQEVSPPSISGAVQLEGTLGADAGIWGANGPISYAYQWESCSQGGEDCAPVEGASEATYVLGSGDLGSSVRVKVTATTPLGARSAVSPPTVVVSGGEVSVEEAQAVAAQTDPAVLAPSTTATLEGQSITPALSDTGEEIASQSTLTSSTISKETAGEFAVNTPIGELSLTPVETRAAAVMPPTIVNGAAALVADSWAATDTIIRPQPLGATAILQLRSAQAPHSFSWHVRLGPDQELTQLPNGSVAVVEAPETPSEPSGGQEVGATGELLEGGEGPAETSEEEAEAEQEEAQPETEEEVPLESLPAAPHSSTPPGEATPGQPQPQQTQAAHEAAATAMSYAEAQTAGKTLMVIAPPAVTDADGHTVNASLSITADVLKLTVDPAAGAAYPLLAEATVAAPSDKESAERDPVKYGISDPLPEKEGHIDQHFNEKGEAVSGFDPNLKNGPLHMSTARLVVPYDVVDSKSKYAAEEKQRLETWLEKVGKEHLTPFITISKDYSVDPCGEEGKPACPPVPRGRYKYDIERLIGDLIAGNRKRGFPPIELWGAWNEPDLAQNPLHHNRTRAAQLWEIAESILAKLAKQHHCGHCTVVAGEFAYTPKYEPDYTSVYRNTLLCHPRGTHQCPRRFWSGLPAIWGFHDYHDVIDRENSDARNFTSFLRHSRLGKPQVFMSEAGVQLQTGEEETVLGDLKATTEEEKAKKREMQLQAAEEFRNLHDGLPSIDREYYYMYTAPSKVEQEHNIFDSALLEVENGELHERPAYCVLAYPNHRCPPVAVTGSGDGFSPGGFTLTGTVNPNALPTEYHFDYGATPSYGKTTATEKLAAGMSNIEVSTQVVEGGESDDEKATVRPLVTCVETTYFRMEAANATGLRHGANGKVEHPCGEGS